MSTTPTTPTAPTASASDALDILRRDIFRDITWDKLYYALSGYVHYRSQTVPHISVGTLHELEMNFILLESGTSRTILVTRPTYAFRWDKDAEQPSPLTTIPYFPWNKPCVSPAADESAKVYIGHLHGYLRSVYYPSPCTKDKPLPPKGVAPSGRLCPSPSNAAIETVSEYVGQTRAMKPAMMKTRTSSPPPGFTSKQS